MLRIMITSHTIKMKLLYKQTFRQLDYSIFKSNKIIKGEQNRRFKILSDVQIRCFQEHLFTLV